MDALAGGDTAAFKDFNLCFDLSGIQRKYGAPNVKISLPSKIAAPKNILYVGMMLYDGDLHLPKNYLVSPRIFRTLLMITLLPQAFPAMLSPRHRSTAM